MLRLTVSLICAILFNCIGFFPVSAESSTVQAPQFKKWYIDPHDTYVRFFATEFKFKTVKGVFNNTCGSIEYDGKSPESLKVHAEIDVDTVDTGIKMRDRSIKSNDFLKVASCPYITFDSTKIVPSSAGHFTMYGNLKIRQEIKEVAVDVQGPSPFSKHPSGRYCFNARATAKLNRKDFGINHDSAIISNEIPVSIYVRVIEGADPEASNRAYAKSKAEEEFRIRQAIKKSKEGHGSD